MCGRYDLNESPQMLFYNPKRRHGHAKDVSPVEFENQYFNRLQSV